jgi:Region found in RelA / SpoT proteins
MKPGEAIENVLGAGATILRQMLVQGAIGLGTEAAIQPGVSAYREQIGAPMKPGEAIENVLGAGAGGALLGGAVPLVGKGIAAAARRLSPGAPEAAAPEIGGLPRQAESPATQAPQTPAETRTASTPSPAADLAPDGHSPAGEAAAGETPALALKEPASPAGELAAFEARLRAAAGTPTQPVGTGLPAEADASVKMGASAKAGAPTDTPTRVPATERAAAAELVARAREHAAANPLEATVPGRAEHTARASEAEAAIRAGAAPSLAEPLSPIVPREIIAGERTLDGVMYSFDPRSLGTDAKVMQYKSGGDAAGVTDRLLGVKRWDPNRSGQIAVYEYRDGRRVVVDGHQRLGLALRLLDEDPSQTIRLYGTILREVDGVTPADARALAALKNIGEGSGTAIDAAKVLRDRPDLAKELPPRFEFARQARALAALSDDAFGAVINELIPAHFGALIGRLAPDKPELHAALVELLKKLDPPNATQAETILRQAIEGGATVETTADLFGEAKVTALLYAERAKVLDGALRQLKRDKAVFSTLTREGDRIAAAGNVLAGDANAARAAADAVAVELLQRLANRKGAISDALTEAARRAKADGHASGAVGDFVGAVRAAAERGDLDGRAGGGAGRALGPDPQAQRAADAASAKAEHEALEEFAEPAGKGQEAQSAFLEAELKGQAAAGDAGAFGERGGAAAASDAGTPAAAKSSGEAKSTFSSLEKSSPDGRQVLASGDQANISNLPEGIFATRRIDPSQDSGVPSKIEAIDTIHGWKRYQSSNDIAENVKAASAALPDFEAFLGFVAQNGPGVRILGARVKDLAAIESKTGIGRPAATVGDYLGGRLEVDDPAAMARALKSIEDSATVIERDDFLAAPRRSGYRAVHLQLRAANGFSAEVQLIPREMDAAQKAAHDIYARWRRRAVTPAETARHDADQARMRALFDTAWSQWQARAGALDGSQTVIPGAERISDRQLAERRMDAPLKPEVSQAPGDVGLFDLGSRAQTDLLDTLRVPAAAELGPDGKLAVRTQTVKEALDDIDAESKFADDLGSCLK